MVTVLLVIVTAGVIGWWAESRHEDSGVFWMVVTMGVWLLCWSLVRLSRQDLFAGVSGLLAHSATISLSPAVTDVAICVVAASVTLALLSSFPHSESSDLP